MRASNLHFALYIDSMIAVTSPTIVTSMWAGI